MTGKVKFNEEITKKIIVAYENGLPLKACANIVGVNRKTIKRWRDKGEQYKTGKYHDFYIDMERAKAKFIYFHHKKIADSEDWKAHKYLLEVTDPEHYVIQNKQSIKSDVKADVKKQYKNKNTSLNKVLKALEESDLAYAKGQKPNSKEYKETLRSIEKKLD